LAQVPDSRLVESRRMYVLPDGEDVAVVEPVQLITFVRAFDNHHGPLPNISRRQFWTYSLRDPGAKAVDLAPQSTAPVMPGDMK